MHPNLTIYVAHNTFFHKDPKYLSFYASPFWWNPRFHFLLGTLISSFHCFELCRKLEIKLERFMLKL